MPPIYPSDGNYDPYQYPLQHSNTWPPPQPPQPNPPNPQIARRYTAPMEGVEQSRQQRANLMARFERPSQHTAPMEMVDQNRQQRANLLARFERPSQQPVSHSFDPVPWQPAAAGEVWQPQPENVYQHTGQPMSFDNNYYRPAPSLIHTDYSHLQVPGQYLFSPHEIEILRHAGFHTPERQLLSMRPAEQRVFAIQYAGWLARHGFLPSDVLAAGNLSHWQRSFLLYVMPFLRSWRFTPQDILSLTQMPDHIRQFVLMHTPRLHHLGFTPSEMTMLAFRPAHEQDYVLRYGGFLRTQGHSSQEIWRFARAAPPLPVPMLMPEPAPAPIPHTSPHTTSSDRTRRTSVAPEPDTTLEPEAYRRHRRPQARNNTSSRSNRSSTAAAPLSSDERRAFDNMGLDAQAQRVLARSSPIVRTFVIAQGPDLLADGLNIQTIMQLARDSDPQEDSTAQAGSTRRRHERQPQYNLNEMFSYLTTEDIAADSLARAVQRIEQRSESPEPLSQPRNNGGLTRVELETLSHASNRWSNAVHLSRSEGEDFYRDMVSSSLAEKLAGSPGYPNLLLLLAGAAYVSDNKKVTQVAPEERANQVERIAKHRERVKTMADYLLNTNDTELFRECDAAAAREVGFCGDGVSYGLTRVAQAIEVRKIAQGELTPRQLFESIERTFLQPRVEDIAARFAREPGRSGSAMVDRTRASESTELYLSLSHRLASEHGFKLTEGAQSSLYGRLYGATDDEVRRAVAQLHPHVRGLSDEYLKEFEGNNTIEQVLRQLFSDDYDVMCEEREGLSEQAGDAMFDHDAPAGTQSTGREVLEALASMEKDWYRDKIKQVLRNPDLLDQLSAA